MAATEIRYRSRMRCTVLPGSLCLLALVGCGDDTSGASGTDSAATTSTTTSGPTSSSGAATSASTQTTTTAPSTTMDATSVAPTTSAESTTSTTEGTTQTGGSESGSSSSTGEPGQDPVGASSAFRATLPQSFTVYDSAPDPDGGIVVVGNILRGSNREAAIARLDDSGQVAWASWTNWASNDQFFGALIMGERVFGVGLTRDTHDQILISEFALDGTYVGSTIFGNGADEHAWSAVAGPNGGMAVAGFSTESGFGGRDGILLKLDSSLNEEFAVAVGGSSEDTFRAVSEAEGGGYVMSGFLGSAASRQAWISIVDAAGTFRLSAAIGGGPSDQALAAAPLGGGRYLFTGDTSAWGAGSNDGLVGLLTVGVAPTVEAWTVGGAGYDSLTELIEVGDDQLVVAGMTESGETPDVWLMQVDASGPPTLQWHHTHPLPRHQFVRGPSACLRADGGFAVAFHDAVDGSDPTFEPGVLYTNSVGLIEDGCPAELEDPFTLELVDDVAVATDVSTTSLSFARTVVTPASLNFVPLALTPVVDLCR